MQFKINNKIDYNLVYKHLGYKETYVLPYSNTIVKIISLNLTETIIDYGHFCCFFDSKLCLVNIIDNFEGEYKDVFVLNNSVYIISSKSITLIYNEYKSKLIEEHDAHEIYKTIIIFVRFLKSEIEIFDLKTFTTKRLIKLDKVPFNISVFEDPLTNICKVKLIYNYCKFIHIKVYDIINKFQVIEYTCKCNFNMMQSFNIGLNTLICQSESNCFALNENNIINKFHDCYLKNIIDTIFLYTINSYYIRFCESFFIIHATHIKDILNMSINNLFQLVERVTDSMCFHYDSTEPIFSQKQDFVVYMYKNNMYIVKTYPSFDLYNMKELDQNETYSSISIDETYARIHLGTVDGDIITYSIC